MKLFAVLALATSASAATLQEKAVPIIKRDTELVTDFAADCIPHSTQCSYNFLINGLYCGAFLPGPDNLPNVENGKCPDDPSRTWSITKTDEGGFKLAIWYYDSAGVMYTYCYTIPAADLYYENDKSTQSQHYGDIDPMFPRVPRSFDVSSLTC